MATHGKLGSKLANIAASQTDGSLIVGVTKRAIRVYGLAVVTGATATNITFNSAPGGSNGVAITCLFANGANGGFVLPYSEAGWFETASGDYLTCTTGAGATTGIQILYGLELIPGSS